jgi:hypothetical protein
MKGESSEPYDGNLVGRGHRRQHEMGIAAGMQRAQRLMPGNNGSSSRLKTHRSAGESGPARSEDGHDLWRKGRFVTHSAGQDLEVVYARGKCVNDSADVCRGLRSWLQVFGPLDAHIDHFARKHE